MKNEKMLIILSMLLIASIATPLLINSAYAIHTGQVYWVSASTPNLITESTYPMIPNNPNDTMVLKNWTWDESPNNQVQLTFQVNNTVGADITRVQFYVQEKGTSNAFFHFYNGSAPLTWTTSILEKDTKGWARLVEFTTGLSPIVSPNTGNFTISFASTIEPVMQGIYYNFTVTTIDSAGYSAEHFIHLMFDTQPPTVTITNPAPNAHVLGTLLPYCGNNYFTVSWNANDTSGLLNYTFLLNRTDDGKTYTKSEGDASNPLTTSNALYTWALNFATTSFNSTTIYFADPLDGHYNVTVWVTDRVGNMGYATIEFDYTHPQKPFWLTPTAGFAALETSYNSATGLVESTQVHQSSTGKVLGTTVTTQGYGFAPTLNPLVPIVITITVRLPTYDLFSGSNYEVPVVQVNTDANGNFTTTFIFPKAPKGVYNVTAWSSSTNPAYVTKCAATFTVSEKAIYQPLGDKPEQLIGPDLINVEATGYMKPDVVPETNTIYTLVNNKDALIGVNQQVLYYWYFDGNGTLRNALTYATGRTVANGIFWPSMQPGTYNLTLFLATTGNWWNLTQWTAMTNDEYTNTITVQETLSLLIDIKADTAYIKTGTDTINSKLDTLSPVIMRIDGNVLTINTTVGMIKATLDQLSPVITRIDAGVATINTRVGSIEASVGELNAIITSVNGYVVNISSTLGPMSTTLSAINTKIDSIDWTGLASLTTAIGQINGTVNGANGILTINTAVGLIKPNTDMIPGIKSNTDTIPALSTNVTNIYTTIPEIKTNTDNVPTLTTILYIAVILSLIAMIAAIAGAFLIYRKTA